MSNIEENLKKILDSRFGKDVRQAIHDGIHDCYEDGKAGAVDLTARERIEEAITTEKSERQAADAAEKSERMQEIAVERARINNLVANNNPTEGNSELIDIRVGADGETYDSAGEAVRSQINGANINYFVPLVNGGNNALLNGSYYNDKVDSSVGQSCRMNITFNGASDVISEPIASGYICARYSLPEDFDSKGRYVVEYKINTSFPEEEEDLNFEILFSTGADWNPNNIISSNSLSAEARNTWHEDVINLSNFNADFKNVILALRSFNNADPSLTFQIEAVLYKLDDLLPVKDDATGYPMYSLYDKLIVDDALVKPYVNRFNDIYYTASPIRLGTGTVLVTANKQEVFDRILNVTARLSLPSISGSYAAVGVALKNIRVGDHLRIVFEKINDIEDANFDIILSNSHLAWSSSDDSVYTKSIVNNFNMELYKVNIADVYIDDEKYLDNSVHPSYTPGIIFRLNNVCKNNLYFKIYIEKIEEDDFLFNNYVVFRQTVKDLLQDKQIEGMDARIYAIEQKAKKLYITCWGDSLTAQGGWTSRLASLTGLTVYNGGTGGENSATIIARQGADVMQINNITIPASGSVQIAARNIDSGILTEFGKKVTPLLQGGGAHVNPVEIAGIQGTLAWTGSSYADMNGTWTFTRSEDGEAVLIDRPTAMRTAYDRNRNNPYLMVIFMGQNGGYSDLDDLVRQHRLMIEHANAEHVIVLGLSSGTAAQRADYEERMKKEFGRYFLSLREYLSTPIYSGDEIVSCYGMADQNVEIDPDYNYGGKTTKQEIEEGTVPHQILADGVHYTSGTKTVIGNYIYKKCCELNIFPVSE